MNNTVVTVAIVIVIVITTIIAVIPIFPVMMTMMIRDVNTAAVVVVFLSNIVGTIACRTPIRMVNAWMVTTGITIVTGIAIVIAIDSVIVIAINVDNVTTRSVLFFFN